MPPAPPPATLFGVGLGFGDGRSPAWGPGREGACGAGRWGTDGGGGAALAVCGRFTRDGTGEGGLETEGQRSQEG